MNKKRKENRYRPKTGKAPIAASAGPFMGHLEVGLKVIMIVTVVVLTTLFFIFVENAVIQSHALSIEKITVSGNVGLSKEVIVDQAALTPGENAFKHNLRHIRQRLLAHPWIADAAVKRVMASEIAITIREQKVIAVVQIDGQYELLLSADGQPFAENDAIGCPVYAPTADAPHRVVDGSQTLDKTPIPDDELPRHPLPVITGLRLSRGANHRYELSGKLHECVMNLLKMPKKEVIQQIAADHETGIEMTCILEQGALKPTSNGPNEFPSTELQSQTSHANALQFRIDEEDPNRQLKKTQKKTIDASSVTIKLGFDNYEEKFKKIRHIVNYMQRNHVYQRICSIDLINPENIVIQIENRNGLPETHQGGA